MILLITDSFLKLQKVNREEYFLPQLRVMDASKLHNFEIMWSEDKPLVESAQDIAEKIIRSSEPVTILAHGKGGLDAVECLIQNPELQDKVEKLVTLQSPIWGTPVADFLTGHPIMGAVTRIVCKLMGCRVQVIEEMSEFNRQVYMIVNKEKIQSLLQNISVISVGTSFEMPFIAETRFEKVMRRIQSLVTKHAGVNDGLVPLFSTRISNEPHVQLENVTHLSLVTPTVAVAPEVESLTRKVLNSVIPTGMTGNRPKFPWGPFGESKTSKSDQPYQLEIS